MKKLAIISLISLFLLVGCDWFKMAESVEKNYGISGSELIEEVMDTEPEVEDVPEEAAADSESKEITLAKCLTETGAKLYTASWCGHCKHQKEAFGDGLQYLDNVECADGDGWAQECQDADVTSVPTWIFGDGTTKSGNTALDKLASLAGCEY